MTTIATRCRHFHEPFESTQFKIICWFCGKLCHEEFHEACPAAGGR